jgi:hypothetical protein
VSSLVISVVVVAACVALVMYEVLRETVKPATRRAPLRRAGPAGSSGPKHLARPGSPRPGSAARPGTRTGGREEGAAGSAVPVLSVPVTVPIDPSRVEHGFVEPTLSERLRATTVLLVLLTVLGVLAAAAIGIGVFVLVTALREAVG